MRAGEKAELHTDKCTSKSVQATPPRALLASSLPAAGQAASRSPAEGRRLQSPQVSFPAALAPGQLSRQAGTPGRQTRTASVGRRQTAATRSAETSCNKLLPPVNELISISSYIYIPQRAKTEVTLYWLFSSVSNKHRNARLCDYQHNQLK